MRKVVLGKGLDALIPADRGIGGEERRLRSIPLERIAPNPMQPRHDFDEAGLHELADSFKRNGIMQPLVVRQNGSMYTIIAGERRYRAARLAGMEEVPAVVMDEVDDARMLELALVENLQREDLNPIEAAQAYRSLMERCNYTQNELAAVVGKNRATVANSLRLLTLPDTVKQLLRAGQLTEGHARAILSLDNAEAMTELAERIVEESLTVRSVEEAARKPKKKRGRAAARRRSPELMDAESFLKQTLGTSVRINHGRKKGRIEIEYYGDDDLNRLLELFQKLR